jgi:hypothetical protein
MMAHERTKCGGERGVLPCVTSRGPGDDFYCLRYRVWYASLDCAYRTRFRTAAGCLDCEQGRFNLARHAADVTRLGTNVLRWRA